MDLIVIGVIAILAIMADWFINLREHRALRRSIVIWERSGRNADEIGFSRPSPSA